MVVYHTFMVHYQRFEKRMQKHYTFAEILIKRWQKKL